ncbi:MAG: thioredoxin family protein [Planctomycetaceae bacterium]|jgi:small redox-active disulfide protein 2|nr:thioredoxin family protein [Planctomycetaceae bacterium]
MKIQILGVGCPRCSQLAENAETAAKEYGLDYTLEKVSDISQILAFDVTATPALVLDGQIYCSGRVPSVSEIKAMFSGNLLDNPIIIR